jgi:hypothetical protein
MGTPLATAPAAASSAAFNPLLVDTDETVPAVQDAPAAADSPAQSAATSADPTGQQGAAPVAPAADTIAAGPADDGQRARALAKHAARRRRYAILAVVVTAAVVHQLKPWSTIVTAGASKPASAVVTGTSAAGDSTAIHGSATAPEIVKADLAIAHDQLRQTGTLTGLTLPGAHVAAAGTTMIAARNVNGTCVLYGILSGTDAATQADPTGQGCTAAAVKAVQDNLATNATAATTQVEQAASSQLATAADSARYFAQHHFVNGSPSMSGLPTTLEGVSASDASDTGATLTVSTPGPAGSLCRTGHVSTDGTLTGIRAC